MCFSHLDPGNGAAHVFKVIRLLLGLTKSHMLLWAAVIALYCHYILFFFLICWLDMENGGFCNLQHRIFKLQIGKSVPLQAWSGPEGSRKLRFPDFMTSAQGGGKVVSHMHRPHLPPGNSPGTHFC